ncbi:MAG: hypothetical protein PHV97_07890, partial [Candidatus Omnitrophica bacterium]|nr:hypothetical protein [Candidatus Omnitrophota bacterium]
GSATDASGQGTVMTGENSNIANGLSGLSDSNNDTSTTAAQDAASSSENVANGTTTMEQLSRIQTGVYHYSGSGTFTQTSTSMSPSAYVGTLTASWDLNFGTKYFENAKVSIDTTPNGGNINVSNVGLASQPFGSGDVAAVFNTTGTNMSAIATIYNSGGQIAQDGAIKVDYSANGGYDQGTGSFTTSHT